MTAEHYPGGELEIFARAERWKAYWQTRIAAYVRGEVAEVGAGIGGNAVALRELVTRAARWTCFEPDPNLAEACRQAVASLPCEVLTGTLAAAGAQRFDTILYLDVLEHIPDDRAEVTRAAAALRGGGHLVVLAPAHPWLYSPFDAAVGHHRRYTRRSLRRLQPPGTQLVALESLDGAGLLASSANRLLLQQAVPSHAQIQTWDKLLVPVSRWLIDPLTRRRLGKSVLAVWQAV